MHLIEDFFNKYPLVEFKKKEKLPINIEGQGDIFFIKTGIVKLVTRVGDEEVLLCVFKSGTFLPFLFMMSTSKFRSPLIFKCVTRVKAYKTPFSDTETFFKRNPKASFLFAKKLANAIVGLTLRITEEKETVTKRVSDLLVYFAQKFGRKDTLGIQIQIPITHDDIASFLGVSRETVTRSLAELKKEGQITIKRRKIIITKSLPGNF